MHFPNFKWIGELFKIGDPLQMSFFEWRGVGGWVQKCIVFLREVRWNKGII